MDFGGQCQSYDVEKHYFPAIEDLAINFIILFHYCPVKVDK